MSSASSQIVLLHGNDSFKVETEARDFVEKHWTELQAQGAVEQIRGNDGTIDEVLDLLKRAQLSLQSMNMFAAENATWIREVEFLGGDLFKNPDVKEAVEQLGETLSAGLGPEQRVLISVSGKLDSRSRFLKALKGVADIREFNRATKEKDLKRETVAELQKACASLGLRAQPAALQELISRVGPDMRALLKEVDKLDLYVGDRRELTVGDVQLMVAATQELQAYLIGDALGNRDVAGLMEMLGRMEQQGVSAVAVMATLQNSLREMAYLRGLMDSKAARLEMGSGGFGKFVYADPAAEAQFTEVAGGRKRAPFRQFLLAKYARNFRGGVLDRMLRLSSEAYAQLFRSPLDPYEQLRVLLLRMLVLS